MLKNILTTVFFFLGIVALPAQDIMGAWYGVLKVQGMELRVVFNIAQKGDGYSATMDSPDQNAKGIPVSSVSFTAPSLKLEIKQAGVVYEGTLNAENVFKGTFKQAGQSLPLDLGRQEITKKEPKRPQTPQAPFTYYSEDVTFENKVDKITLAGTLTLPKKEGKFPCVILISGSGGQNRDCDILGHKTFLVLADYLTNHGFGVLRYDDRGIGESKGNFSTATSEDFAKDVESAIAYLKTRPEIDKKKIGLIGHSEGGMIAPIVASKSKDVRFLVSLAGTGVRGDKILLAQQELIARAEGEKEDIIAKTKQYNQRTFDLIQTEQNTETLKTKLAEIIRESIPDMLPNLPKERHEMYIKQQINAVLSPWMLYFLRYDPAPTLAKVKCPVLALNGSKDLQVPPKENLEGFRQALAKAGNKSVTITELPFLNHLFQECKTGSISEYGEIEQTFSPAAMTEIGTWLWQQVKGK